jgi:hypothetical protein
MLRTLARQVRDAAGSALESPVELLVCVDRSAHEDCRAFVLETLGRHAELFDMRFLVTTGLEYYELKNRAVAEAAGDLLIFLDCDVLPEPGWLAHLLAPFEDPAISVVGGNTYVDPTGVYSRVFAANWIFPLRASTDELAPMTRLATNNVAFRRDTAERFPFPAMPETSRGACQLLRNLMEERGVAMVTAQGAHVRHPPPIGIGQFLTRSFSRGRDRLFMAEPGPSRTARGTWRRLVGDVKGAVKALTLRRRQVGLSLAALPAAMAIALAFVACSALGELLTLADREFMTRHFRV